MNCPLPPMGPSSTILLCGHPPMQLPPPSSVAQQETVKSGLLRCGRSDHGTAKRLLFLQAGPRPRGSHFSRAMRHLRPLWWTNGASWTEPIKSFCAMCLAERTAFPFTPTAQRRAISPALILVTQSLAQRRNWGCHGHWRFLDAYDIEAGHDHTSGRLSQERRRANQSQRLSPREVGPDGGA